MRFVDHLKTTSARHGKAVPYEPPKMPAVVVRKPESTPSEHQWLMDDMVAVLREPERLMNFKDQIAACSHARTDRERRAAFVRLAAWALRRALEYETRIRRNNGVG